MESKQVTKEINSVIRPILKSNGFKKFSGRTYWKYETNRIDILNFQSFNSYNADVMGCTTFSFAVKLATFMKYIPYENKIKEKDGLKRPTEYQGHFRSGITKTIAQKEFPRKDIWFIGKDGKYLNSAISDCKTQIEKRAFDWFNQFEDNQNVLRILMEDQVDMNGTWGFGNMDSPNRNEFIAYMALELGENELALSKFKEFVRYYKTEYEKIKADYYSRDLAELYLSRVKTGQKKLRSIKTTHNNGYK